MSFITIPKDLFSKSLKITIQNPYNVGLKIFHCGILFLAAAPLISFVLLFFSSIIGGLNRPHNFFKDKLNFPFIAVAILMILNCLLITFFKKDLNSFEITKIWIGLSNWIPFFWCFWGFQPFLESRQLRIKSAKLFIIGSLPVLISGFSQYFLKIYGPFNFFNNLIIWYQRPLDSNHAVTGLFNNQNYAGAWLCIIFPLCLVFLGKRNNNKFQKILFLLICVSFFFMIVLTTSRAAILAIFISLFLSSDLIRNKFLALISLLSIPLILNSMKVYSVNFQSKFFNFAPFESLIKKASLTNFSNIQFDPRMEVWQKSLELINSNPLTGYGAGSFEALYKQTNGVIGEIFHSHNLFFELAISHGLPSSLIIFFTMIYIITFSWRINFNKLSKKSESSNGLFKNFDKAWIISFIIFFLIHIVDITYFDGRISTISWILLSGMACIIKSKKGLNRPYQV